VVRKLAASVEKARVMGVKKRRICGTRKQQQRAQPSILGTLEARLLTDMKNNPRRAITLPWVKAKANHHLKVLREAIGHEPEAYGGRPFKASTTWCWAFLIRQGMVSRRAGKKRSNTPDDSQYHMIKWLHLLREVVLQPELRDGEVRGPAPVDLVEEASRGGLAEVQPRNFSKQKPKP